MCAYEDQRCSLFIVIIRHGVKCEFLHPSVHGQAASCAKAGHVHSGGALVRIHIRVSCHSVAAGVYSECISFVSLLCRSAQDVPVKAKEGADRNCTAGDHHPCNLQPLSHGQHHSGHVRGTVAA